jgi:hypothetical protein
MFKRIMLALAFMSTFGVVSAGITETAGARRVWGGPYVTYGYVGPRAYYYRYGVPYRLGYRGYYDRLGYRSYYRSRYYRRYYAPYYGPRYYGYPGYYYGPRAAVRIGF